MSTSTHTSEWKSRSKAQLLDDVQILIEQRDREIARRIAAEADADGLRMVAAAAILTIARVQALAAVFARQDYEQWCGDELAVLLRAALATPTEEGGRS